MNCPFILSFAIICSTVMYFVCFSIVGKTMVTNFRLTGILATIPDFSMQFFNIEKTTNVFIIIIVIYFTEIASQYNIV